MSASKGVYGCNTGIPVMQLQLGNYLFSGELRFRGRSNFGNPCRERSSLGERTPFNFVGQGKGLIRCDTLSNLSAIELFLAYYVYGSKLSLSIGINVRISLWNICCTKTPFVSACDAALPYCYIVTPWSTT